MSMGTPLRSDEESRYLAALNMMAELSGVLADLDTAAAARAPLQELIAMCRADFEARLVRDRDAGA